jgi:hypothetical protein
MLASLGRRHRQGVNGLAASVLLALASCGGGEGSDNQAPSPAPAPAPTPTPSPSPPPTTQFSIPFNLTSDFTFDVFGWQGDGTGAVAPATQVGFRWNAQTTSYEVMMPNQEWGRLTGSASPYSIYNPNGTKQPYDISVRWNVPTIEGANPRTPVYAARANVAPSTPPGNSAIFAYGIPTQAGDVPQAGTRTCTYNVDDDGSGTLVFDLATGLLTGHLQQYYATDYALSPSQFTPGATTFTATGPLGPIEGRFYGPQGREAVIRWIHPDGFAMVWIMICDDT